MPIRTNRGRSAVYRTFWGWPLRSPRHLAAAALVLAGIGVGLGFALASGEGGQSATATPTSTPRPNMFDPASRAAAPEAASAPSASAPDEAPDAALDVADAWVRAFLTTPEGISSEQWAQQMRPYTTDEVYPVLEMIDPANVPDAELTGAPRTVSTGIGKAEVDVPTSSVVVRLLLVATPDGWRVAGFEQVG